MASLDDDLREKLLKSMDAQQNALTLIKDALYEAAFRFSGKRTSVIEKKIQQTESFSAKEIFVDVFLAIAIGPVAGVLLSRVTDVLFRKVTRSRSFFNLHFSDKEVDVFTKNFMRVAISNKSIPKQAQERYHKKVRQELKRKLNNNFSIDTNSIDYKYYKLTGNSILEGVQEVASDEIRSLNLLNTPSQWGSVSELPEAPIISATNSYIANERAKISGFTTAMIANITKGHLPKDTLNSLMQVYENPIMTVDLTGPKYENAKAMYRSLFETMMWVRYVGDPGRFYHQPRNPKSNLVDRRGRLNVTVLSGPQLRERKVQEFNRVFKGFMEYWANELISPHGNGLQSFMDIIRNQASAPLFSFGSKISSAIPSRPPKTHRYTRMKDISLSHRIKLEGQIWDHFVTLYWQLESADSMIKDRALTINSQVGK